MIHELNPGGENITREPTGPRKLGTTIARFDAGCALINLYKYLISPLLGNNCRFLPTCSEYTKEAIIKFGLIKGTSLGFKRIIKCHPWGKSGHDPIK
jgi:hypothetical protein